MTATKSFPGFESPAAGFDEPFEMLDACHDRLRRSLELLERLQRYLLTHAVDEQARQAALDALRYFTVAAPLHHEDEERHVVPLLRQSGQRVWEDASTRLMQDHEQIAWNGEASNRCFERWFAARRRIRTGSQARCAGSHG